MRECAAESHHDTPVPELGWLGLGCGENQLGPLGDCAGDCDEEELPSSFEPDVESEGNRLGSDGSERPGVEALAETR